MQYSREDAEGLLATVFEATGLDLRVAVKERADGLVFDLDGTDADLLQADAGELLEAIQHLLNQIYGRSLPGQGRVICDVKGFRASREAELRAMAKHAADRVRTTGFPFTFGPMNASERRVIHLSLADSNDLFTESVGEGTNRKLRIGLKDAH